MEAIAPKVVSKYSKTFQDTISGASLGRGYDSQANALGLYDRCNYITQRKIFYSGSPPPNKNSLEKNESYGGKVDSWNPESPCTSDLLDNQK